MVQKFRSWKAGAQGAGLDWSAVKETQWPSTCGAMGWVQEPWMTSVGMLVTLE